MPTLSSLLKEYLKKNETLSLIYDENYKYEVPDGSALNPEIIKSYLIFTVMQGHGIKFELKDISSGTQGAVYSARAGNMYKSLSSFLDKHNDYLFRIKKGVFNDNMPKEVVLKVQQFKTENKYWEARVLREETIMKRLSTSSLKEYVPAFYLGCTLIIPMEDNKRFGVRLTFMEHIDMVPLYRILQESDKNKVPVPRSIYEQIEDVVMRLWKLGVSHNDLSVNNILVSGFLRPKIKLIDFGLSTTISTSDFASLKDGDGFNTYKDRYVAYFAGLPKDEQNGSNVEKLSQLSSLLSS